MKNEKNYALMAKEILELLGGTENIEKHVNCMTRLRVTPVNHDNVDLEGLSALDYTIQVQVIGGVVQVVLGPGTVNKVEAEFASLRGGTTTGSTQVSKDKRAFKTVALEFIQQTMMPVLPALVGGSLLIALSNILGLFGILPDKDLTPFLYFIDSLGRIVTSSLGIFVAFTATRALKSESFLPLLFAILIYYGDLADVAFGPIKLSNGIGGMIGVIITVIIVVNIENRVRKVIPQIVNFVFVPVVTLLLSSVAFILIAAPISNLISLGVFEVVNFILNGSPVVYVLGNSLLAGLWPLLVLTGTHQVAVALMMPYLELNGIMPLFAATSLFTASVAGAAFGSLIKYKDTKTKETATTTGITAILGITEPAIYGLLIPKGKNFVMTLISGAIGGLVVGLLGIQIGIGASGIFIVAAVVDPATMLLPYLLIYLGTVVLAAVLVIIFGAKE